MGVGAQPGAGITELSRLKGRGGGRRGGASRDLEGTLEGGDEQAGIEPGGEPELGRDGWRGKLGCERGSL